MADVLEWTVVSTAEWSVVSAGVHGTVYRLPQVWFATMKKTDPFYPVDIVLAPEWWHRHTGITFDRDFFFHPARRVEEEARMERVLYDRWGQYGLGSCGSRPEVGPAHLACGYLLQEMLGCRVEYRDGHPPQVIPARQERLDVDPDAATIIWGILGTGVALLLTRTSGSILDVWWTPAGIPGGGMIGLFLLGMISREAHNPVGLTRVILGASVMAWMTLTKDCGGQFHSFLIPVFGTLTILLAGIVLSASVNRHKDNA